MKRRCNVAAGALALVWAAACSGGRPAAPAPESAPTGLTVLVGVPANTPADAAVHIAGSFNAWNPGAPAYRLARSADGRYRLTLPADVRGPIEFKFTLGSWPKVEMGPDGADIANRSFTVPATGSATYTATVARWRDDVPVATKGSGGPSTATKSVSILSDSFPIPQLSRTRRVWLYLPPDYATSGRRYPVLYLHDGQNVFNASTAYAGEWGVDETLDSLHAQGDPGVIVVAVDNGGTKRMDEYSPWHNDRFGGGEGGAYVEFLVRTLKPYIDAHYRTLPDRLHTGIGGSSMGGLISLYAILEHPEVFGRALVFSPAFWIAPQAFDQARQARPLRPDPRIYMDIGWLEGQAGDEGVYARLQQKMAETLAAAGFDTTTEVRSVVRADGKHAEWFWRREFPAAYLWLFGKR